MKNIALCSLSIVGFKGIRALTLELAEHDAIISGANGTGKTSVYDAVLWLLFGKDSADTKADVKPVDENGNRISGTDVDVSAKYIINNDGTIYSLALRRVLHEVWSGAGNNAVYARDETLCWINDVPKKVDKEYLPEICANFGVNEGQFKLLSSFTAFMALHWSERRKALFGLIDPLNDPSQRIINGFEHINDILMGNTPEDARKRLMEQRKRQNDQLNAIPARIDELQRAARVVSDQELAEAKASLTESNAEIERIDAELTGANQASESLNKLMAQKAMLERKRLTEETALSSEYQQRMNDLQRKHRAEEDCIALSQDEIRRLNASIERTLDDINREEGRRNDMRVDYKAINAEVYVDSNDDFACPACGQLLPPSQVENARERACAEWTRQHNAALAANVESGKRCKEAIEALQGSLASLRSGVAVCEANIQASKNRIKGIRADIDALGAEGMPTTNAEIERVSGELAKIDKELASIGTNEYAEELRQRKRTLAANVAACNATIATAGAQEANKERIAELEREKAVAGDILTGIENDLVLLGRYVSARCELLEGSINGLFLTIRWKLFNTLKNGSIEDCCDATVNGVPYGAGLNNAAEINAGLEIIRVMSNSIEVSVPCFVDNAESVNHVAGTGGQMILLKVTEEPALSYTLID